MEEKLGSGYRLSILVFKWAEKTGGQFSVCNLLCSVHRAESWERIPASAEEPKLCSSRSCGCNSWPRVCTSLQLGPCSASQCQVQRAVGIVHSGDCPFCRHGRLETSLFPLLSMVDPCPNTQVLSPNCPNLLSSTFG